MRVEEQQELRDSRMHEKVHSQASENILWPPQCNCFYVCNYASDRNIIKRFQPHRFCLVSDILMEFWHIFGLETYGCKYSTLISSRERMLQLLFAHPFTQITSVVLIKAEGQSSFLINLL